MNNEILFKVKCIYIDNDCLTVGKEYNAVEDDEGFYKVKNDSGITRWYHNNRFEILDRESNPKGKQEFSVGDKVVINKISSCYVALKDKNVKEGDIATVIKVSSCDLELSNANWECSWWFLKADVSLVADNNPLDDKSQDYRLLSPQEVVQAILDDKDVEIQYTDGTWNAVSPINTTLHQLTTLNFRLKSSLEDKRKAVIKKLLTTKVAVLCKCWDDDGIGETIVAITRIDDDYTYPYMNNCIAYKYAIAIDDNGNEITNV